MTILLAAAGAIEDPSARSANIQSANLDADVPRGSKSKLSSTRAFDSAIAKVGEQYTDSSGGLSEYRAVLRAGVADLHKKIDQAIEKTARHGHAAPPAHAARSAWQCIVVGLNVKRL